MCLNLCNVTMVNYLKFFFRVSCKYIVYDYGNNLVPQYNAISPPIKLHV